MDDLFSYAAKQAQGSEPPEGVRPDVASLFERLALQLWAKGRRRFSADAILHRIRWEFTVERDGEWKCNNNHTSVLARWFIANHPDKADFFETRVKRAKEAA
ncbi:hypothetical protein I6F35_33500 [Bradyrhizobium sp. BRP22]|uniref:hypothetical protein n=1 Tax=Bradyrhizobium sp. BRP22 TaxID=2793821 RepID=UPI001CD70E0B|nr:hypothetical protein [Bradyrhizobium sp. BRP22]MCA1458051.1 hypothetical protein [Bradyrhizobium sp. BRP22]